MRRIAVMICITSLTFAAATGPAGAAGVDSCTLITKKELSKILGARVVDALNVVDPTSGGQTCTYSTKKYATKAFKAADSTVGFVLQWVPLSGEIAASLAANPAMGGVAGAAAHLLDDGTVAAVQGSDVLIATAQNVKGGLPGASKKALRALKLAVPRLPSG